MKNQKIYLFYALLLLFVSSCQRASNENKSTLKLTFSKANPDQQKKGSLGVLSFPSGKTLCFAVSITGPGIETETSSCKPDLGARAGFVTEGSSISLEVNKGTGRAIDLYLYTAPPASSCPNIAEATINPKLLFKVASVQNVDMTKNETVVEMPMEFPGETQHLANQLNMPSTCLPVAEDGGTTNPAEFVVGSGNQSASSASLKLRAQFGTALSINEKSTTPSGVQLHVKQ